MHRTKTSAMILVGVVVSAVSGCVAVQPRPAHTPPTDLPRLSQDVQPQIVQAPAREALEAVLPPAPTPSAPGGGAEREAPRRAAVARPAPASARQAPAEPAAPPKAADRLPRILPSPPVPVPAGAAAGTGTDVCALGEGYGGWRPDSPQARICRETYGH
ncbi:hypothetical protein [Streptomyces sp. H27-C3]|uniref:hypothetical protein n=1 Tax=Streptomyces sp. H27-C3 TaxID=3046305 RepID=UPI0024BB7014|nr:hypothetical protein [Streptomyces sp. H27-C3]MDJ0462303.1 hypothetical protein [Streptomyces sp. H27-C3]